MAKFELQQWQPARYVAEGEPGGPGRQLVSLLELAEREAQRKVLPFGEAARRVAEALSQPDSATLFIGRAWSFSLPMAADHVWFPGSKAAPARTVFSSSSGTPLRWGDASPRFVIGQTPAVSAVPALVGRDGALALFKSGTARQARASDCRLGGVGCLAILEADASRIFDGRIAELKLVQPVGQVQRDRPKIGPPAAPIGPYPWEKESRYGDALNRQFNELVAFYVADPRTKKKAKHSARADLAQAWKVSPSTINSQTTGDPRKAFEKRAAAASQVVKMR